MKHLFPTIACLVLFACDVYRARAVEAALRQGGSELEAPPRPARARQTVVVPVENDLLGIPPARYPPLTIRFETASDVVPAGWTIEHLVHGELNGDGRSDMALVLRQADPANVIRHDGLGSNPLDTNPRLLVISLADGGGYAVLAENHTFIPRHTRPNLEDVLQRPPAIANGVLSIRLEQSANAGGWTMSNSTAHFQYDGGALCLIGHDYTEVHRGSGEMLTRTSIS